jgi:hypothetical protein
MATGDLRRQTIRMAERIEGLERDVRIALEAGDHAADRASRDAEDAKALERFQLEPTGQSPAAITAWCLSRGIRKPANQRKAIEAVLRARGDL